MKSVFAWLLIIALHVSCFSGCVSQDDGAYSSIPTTPTDPSGSNASSEPVTNPNTEPSVEVIVPTETEPQPEPPSMDLGYYTAEHYLYYPDLFVPAWTGQWEVPAQMLDFEEKFASFCDPDGRLMSIGHRGERNKYYPENSIEGILSVIMAGVDMVEVDIAKTKDNVLVLMHDDTLTRTTNVKKLRESGVEGLPESNKVKDWTLEQLRQLRLKMPNGTVTNYVIPTLEECIMVCKDRCFITLDKSVRFVWQLDILPLMKKHQAYREVLVPYNYCVTDSFAVVRACLDMVEKAAGFEVAYMAWCSTNQAALDNTTAYLNELNICKTLRCSEYDPNNDTLLAPYVGNYRIYMETLEVYHDKVEVWSVMNQSGYNLIMSDLHIYELCRFIASEYFEAA